MTRTSASLPPGLRNLVIDRVEPAWPSLREPECGAWKLWIHTNDYVLGTYLLLHDSGKIERVTVRADEGDEVVLIKPED